jgi:hypothetical protein
MDPSLHALAQRIAEALERLAPPPPPPIDLHAADAFVWHPANIRLVPVPRVSRVNIDLLKGREHAALRPRSAGQQRDAVGLPRHGQILPGQGRARGGER